MTPSNASCAADITSRLADTASREAIFCAPGGGYRPADLVAVEIDFDAGLAERFLRLTNLCGKPGRLLIDRHRQR